MLREAPFPTSEIFWRLAALTRMTVGRALTG